LGARQKKVTPKIKEGQMKKFYILLVSLFMINGAMGQQKKPCSSCLPDGITFATQAQIDSFQINYPNCTQILGSVLVGGDNPSFIDNLNGLNVLKSIGGSLVIANNQSLISLAGLDSLNSIGGNLSIGDAFFGIGNPVLKNLSALHSVSSVPGTLFIVLNPSLQVLTGLESLTSIGCLSIQHNDSLVGISELINVNTIVTSFDVGDNPVLSSLAGLDNIDAGALTGVLIEGNSQLSTCDVQSICNYLASPNTNVTIENNATGCNSIPEVKDSCGITSIRNLYENPIFSIYPNPTSTTFSIETTLSGKFIILNFNGQRLLQQEITKPTATINISTLPSGVYIVKITGERTVQVKKLFKQ
jgi:hypothetical protein